MHYPYFKKLLAADGPPVSASKRRVWQMLVRGRELLADMKKQHCWIKGEASRGTPFPVADSDHSAATPAASKTA